MTVLDLFAGPGGWDLAARRLGLDPIGVEFEPDTRASREAAGLRTHGTGNVRHLDLTEFIGLTGLIASPSCQTYSQAGKGSGRRALDLVLSEIEVVRRTSRIRYELYEDERTGLALEPLRAALLLHPEWVAWEQVPTVQPLWDACAVVLREQGYSVWTGRLQAEAYGVPQARTRSILMASRVHEMAPPPQTHSRYHRHAPARLDPGLPRWITMAEALDLGPEPDDATAWAWHRPATTVVRSFRPEIIAGPGYRRKGDPSRQNAVGSIQVTPAQLRVLQGVPPDFPFQGGPTKQLSLIGAMMPVPWTYAILSAVTKGTARYDDLL